MLRAIVMSRRQLVRMVIGESVLLGVFGGGTAAALGAYVADLWVVSSLARSLGWLITVHIPWSAIVRCLSAGLLVGAIAGFILARRVAGIPVREALEGGS
jgi:ABC-type antimicrobial peptide transport system permease subunit